MPFFLLIIFFKSWKWKQLLFFKLHRSEEQLCYIDFSMFGRIVLKAKKQTLKVSSCEEPKRCTGFCCSPRLWLNASAAIIMPANPYTILSLMSLTSAFPVSAHVVHPSKLFSWHCFDFCFIINGWMRWTRGNKDYVSLIQIMLWNPNQEGFRTGGQWGWSPGAYVEWRFRIQVNTHALASRYMEGST